MPQEIPFQVINLDNKSFHPMIMGELEGRAISLILDTGASRTILGSHLTANFPTVTDDSEEVFAAGINAEKMAVAQVVIPEISLGDCTFKELTVFSSDLNEISDLYRQMTGQPMDGLLGCDFFLKYQATINFKTKKLILPGIEPASFSKSETYISSINDEVK